MNVNYKKSLKLITLLITALLIAVVSAQVYTYMYIEGSGTITPGGLSWQKGDSAPTGAFVQGDTVKNLNLTIEPDKSRNFTDCVRILNADTVSHTFSLEATVMAGNVSKFTTFDLVVYDSNNATVGSKLSIKNQESKTDYTIPGSQTLYIRFEVTPLMGETSGYIAFTVKLTYE